MTNTYSRAHALAASGSPRRRRDRERGMIVIWALMAIMLIAGIIVAGSDEFAALDGITQTEFSAAGQAHSVAEAGLVDGYAWLRRQTTQPVAAFTPQRDLAATPAINETEDPSIGLVRTFEISPGLWARYEVARGTPAEAFTDSNNNGVFDQGEPYADDNGDGRRSPGTGTRDVSTERGLPGTGTVWLLESTARVFRRTNASLPLGVGPNRQIASEKMATEVRRLNILPPSAAAICSRRGDRVTIGSRGRVRAKTTAIAYGEDTGSPNTSSGEVPGAKTAIPGYSDYLENVFGVGMTMLKSMADISTSDPVEAVPARLADYSLVVIDGDVTFNEARPLRGTALVVVKGNVNIQSGSNSFFNGVLYVDGNFTARAPAYIRGTVIVTGTTNVAGTGGDYCEIEHDPDTLAALQVKMGQYRYTKSRYIPVPKMQDGRPNESVTITSPMNPIVPPTDGGEVPEGNFVPDLLMDAIDEFLMANPGTAGRSAIEGAVAALSESRILLTLDPPDRIEALDKVKAAMLKLRHAANRGAELAPLMDDISGASPSIFEGISAMVDAAITNGGENPEARAAYVEANAARALGDAAAAAVGPWNEWNALGHYMRAAGDFRDAMMHVEGVPVPD